MRRTLRFATMALCGALALTIAACEAPAPGSPSPASAAEIERGVRQMASSIPGDLARDGPIGWLRYFDQGPEFFMVNDGKIQFSSFHEAEAFIGGFSLGVTHMELTWEGLRVDPLAPGVAVMAASYGETFTDRKGNVTRYSGYFTGTAIQTSSGWRIRDAHWSSLPPSR